MATLREIRRRIAGVKNTEKITKAMKMVAAAKLRRAQDAVIAARPYARKMRSLLQHLARVVDVSADPHFVVRDLKQVVVLVVTADRGLCGAFNSNILKAAVAHIATNYRQMFEEGRVKLVVVGKKGSDFFTKRDYAIIRKHVGIFAGLNFGHAETIVTEIVGGFLNGEYDRVDVVYNEFKSIARQHIVIEQFLPIPPAEIAPSPANGVPGTTPGSRTAQVDYIYEPSSRGIISALVPKHLNFQVWRVLLESMAAEQGARMAAMDNASTNAADLIRTLQLVYNKARQAAITKELLEIVSGAEALKKAG